MTSKNIAVYLNVEPGPLEVQAHLLVNSLQLYCTDDFQVFAHCRKDRVDDLQPETRELLSSNNVELVSLTNPFRDGYPAGNKIVRATLNRNAPYSLFLDTDTFLVRESSFSDITVAGSVSVCSETRNAWTNRPRIWRRVYAEFGLQKPNADLELLYGDLSHLFFNAGMVLFPSEEFGALWLETALRIDAIEGLPGLRPWLDQFPYPLQSRGSESRR